jgi:hypothetical protein
MESTPSRHSYVQTQTKAMKTYFNLGPFSRFQFCSKVWTDGFIVSKQTVRMNEVRFRVAFDMSVPFINTLHDWLRRVEIRTHRQHLDADQCSLA